MNIYSGFDSLRYQIFWEIVGLKRGPLSHMSTTEELLGRKSSGSGLEIRKYSRRDPSHWPRGTLYTQKLLLSTSTSGGHSVGIVLLRTQATVFSFSSLVILPSVTHSSSSIIRRSCSRSNSGRRIKCSVSPKPKKLKNNNKEGSN
jgi:hypothetical protein